MRLKIFIIFLFLSAFGVSDYIWAEEENQSETRVIIAASGPTEFNSYWLNDPPRLVVEFQSRNIISKLNNEIIVNQGIIKKITSDYFKETQNSPLESLTFEFACESPYEIWQKENDIIIDIQAPFEGYTLSIDEKGIFTGSKIDDLSIEKLKALDSALMQAAGKQLAAEVLAVQPAQKIDIAVVEANKIEMDKKETPVSENKPYEKLNENLNSSKSEKNLPGTLLWLVELALMCALTISIWHRNRKATNKRNGKFETEWRKKNKSLGQQEIFRKTIEKAASEEERQYRKDRDSLGYLKDNSFENRSSKREILSEKEEKANIEVKFLEKRKSIRTPLTKNYNNTIILRIESQDEPCRVIKSFAENIALNGLCLATKKELAEKESMTLRLFFFGDNVPMIKIQGHIVWKKAADNFNYYGVYFDLMDEKDKAKLNRYLDSKLVKDSVV